MNLVKKMSSSNIVVQVVVLAAMSDDVRVI